MVTYNNRWCSGAQREWVHSKLSGFLCVVCVWVPVLGVASWFPSPCQLRICCRSSNHSSDLCSIRLSLMWCKHYALFPSLPMVVLCFALLFCSLPVPQISPRQTAGLPATFSPAFVSSRHFRFQDSQPAHLPSTASMPQSSPQRAQSRHQT